MSSGSALRPAGAAAASPDKAQPLEQRVQLLARRGGELGWLIPLIQEDSFAKNNSIGIVEVSSMDIMLSMLQVVPISYLVAL